MKPRPRAVAAVCLVAAAAGRVAWATEASASADSVAAFAQSALATHGTAEKALKAVGGAADAGSPVSISEVSFATGAATFTPPLPQETAKLAFHALDINQDDNLDSAEFLAAFGDASALDAEMLEMRKRILENYDTLDDAFAEMDASPTDLDAVLDDDPLNLEDFTRAVTQALNSPLTKEKAQHVFAGIDSDKDGLLQKHEFLCALGGDCPTTLASTTTTTVTSAPPTVTRTRTTTTTTINVKGFCPGAKEGTVTFDDFHTCMTKAHSSPEEAFGAMGMDPADVNTFAALASKFVPPLTKAQAKYAFGGIDVDSDQLLTRQEFLALMKLGHFFPRMGELFVRTESDQPEPQTTPNEGFGDIAALPPRLLFFLLVAYFARTVLVAVGLPGALGPVLTGAGVALLAGKEASAFEAVVSDRAQEFLFLLALVAVGTEAPVVGEVSSLFAAATLGLLPAIAEMVAVVGVGSGLFNLRWSETLALATALFAANDGIVAPRMRDFSNKFPGHHLPRFVRLYAPLEGFAALFATSLLICFSSPLRAFGVSGTLAACVRAGVSLLLGVLLGVFGGQLICRRTAMRVLGRQFFSGMAPESAVLFLALALAAFGIGSPGLFSWAPMKVSLQPELSALAASAGFAASADDAELRTVKEALGGVWLFGQLLLLGALGAATVGVAREHGASSGQAVVLALASHGAKSAPMILAGLCARLGVVVGATCLTQRAARPCPCARCLQDQGSSIVSDALFFFLATLPRSASQAAIASGPMLAKLLLLPPPGSDDVAGKEARATIVMCAAVYVVFLSSAGTVLLDYVGPTLLRSSHAARRCEASVRTEVCLAAEGWTSTERLGTQGLGLAEQGGTLKLGLISDDDVLFQDADAPAFPAKEAVTTLARVYDMDPGVLARAVFDCSSGGSGMQSRQGAQSSYQQLTFEGSGYDNDLLAEIARGGDPTERRARIRRLVRDTVVPAAALFEAHGAAHVPEPAADRAHSKAVRL